MIRFNLIHSLLFVLSTMSSGCIGINEDAFAAKGGKKDVHSNAPPKPSADTTAPVISITTQPNALYNNRNITIDFSASDNSSTTLSYLCRIDSGAFNICTTNTSFTLPTTLSEGSHSVQIQVTDSSGNIGTAMSNTFTLDLTPPVITNLTGPANCVVGRCTNTVTFSTSDALSAPVTSTCSVNGATASSCTSPHTMSATIMSTVGVHSIAVRAVDRAGNITSKTHTFTIAAVATEPPTDEPNPISLLTAFFTANFENSVLGTAINEFAKLISTINTVYSSEIAGPFGGNRVVKQTMAAEQKGFGGRLVDMDLGEGNEVWIRWYEYFPIGFCFANGTNGDASGGAGAIKWMRFQYPGTTERITFEVEAQAGCTAPCNKCLANFRPHSVIGESMSWKERYGNMAFWFEPFEFEVGRWHAIQVYMKLSHGSADKNDGSGLIRIWVDDILIGEKMRNTLPTRTIASTDPGNLKSVHWGNYWNGGAPKTQSWFVDEFIFTAKTPSTKDAKGNPYIDPSARAD